MEKKMLDALNDQMKREFDSAYIYLGMSAWLEDKGLKGMASWMMMQYKEEMMHAMKFYAHIQERGEMPVVPQIEKPDTSFSSAKEIFEKALQHEKFVTKWINNTFDVAVETKDRPAENMLRWFIDEQVEEEASVGEIVDYFEMIKDSGNGLIMLDHQLASRQPEQ